MMETFSLIFTRCTFTLSPLLSINHNSPKYLWSQLRQTISANNILSKTLSKTFVDSYVGKRVKYLCFEQNICYLIFAEEQKYLSKPLSKTLVPTSKTSLPKTFWRSILPKTRPSLSKKNSSCNNFGPLTSCLVQGRLLQITLR